MRGKGQYWFKKEKLAVGFGYPLKRSDLDTALADAGVWDTIFSVRYLSSGAVSDPVLELVLTTEADDVHGFASGRCLLTLRALPSASRSVVEAILISEGLPVVCAWLAEGSRAGSTWRGSAHGLTLSVEGGVLRQVRF